MSKSAFLLVGAGLAFNAGAADEPSVTRVFSGATAQQRFGQELLSELPRLANLPDNGMPLIVLFSQDLIPSNSSRPTLAVSRTSPEWDGYREKLTGLLSRLLPAGFVTNPGKEIEKFDEALANLIHPHESSTVLDLGRKACVIVMGDGSESAGELATNMADVTDDELPILQNLATLDQYKWLLVHEARHCAQLKYETGPIAHRTGDEADADAAANKAFPELAPVTLRERAIAGLHLVRPKQTQDDTDLRALSVHATALPLMASPDNPYALDTKTITDAYRPLAKHITRELLRSGAISGSAEIWVGVIDETLAGKSSISLADEAARDSFRHAREVLVRDGDDGIRKLISPKGQTPDAFDEMLVWHATGREGSISGPALNAPILSAYLSSEPDLPPLTRLAGLLYLRAVADLDPSLEKYALPLPQGISFPPLPQKKVSVGTLKRFTLD